MGTLHPLDTCILTRGHAAGVRPLDAITDVGAAMEEDLFVLVLRAKDLKPRATWAAQRQRVVFLHGWLQDHTSWLRVAHDVRERWDHDCCLIDWPAHGLAVSHTRAPVDIPLLPTPTLLTASS